MKGFYGQNMGTFSKSHNIVKRQLGIWRSIHGYGAVLNCKWKTFIIT